MIRRFFSVIKNSIFLRLVLIFGVTIIAISISFVASFKLTLSDNAEPPLLSNTYYYLKLLIKEIGNPPNVDTIEQIAQQTSLSFRIEGQNFSWASNSDVPQTNSIKFRTTKLILSKRG